MNTENPYYDLYVKETKAHNACALREQSLLKDVEFAGREMERLKDALEKEKADHLDTQHKWNEALDIGIGVVEERDSLRTRNLQLILAGAKMRRLMGYLPPASEVAKETASEWDALANTHLA